MNSPLTNLSHGIRVLVKALVVANLWFAAAQAQTPVGSWDCLLTGSEHGVAQVSLMDDGSVTGIAVYTFLSRDGANHTNHGVVLHNIFGSARLSGQWAREGAVAGDRITGYINFVSPALSEPTRTNGFSFRGSARGEKLTFVAKGYAGRMVFHGSPLSTAPDVSGTFRANGLGQRGRLPFVEIFNLTPVPGEGTNNSILNCYIGEGGGPGYEYDGVFLVSQRNYAAFAQTRNSTGDPLAAYAGRFDPSSGRGLLTGTDGVHRSIKLKVARVE